MLFSCSISHLFFFSFFGGRGGGGGGGGGVVWDWIVTVKPAAQ